MKNSKKVEEILASINKNSIKFKFDVQYCGLKEPNEQYQARLKDLFIGISREIDEDATTLNRILHNKYETVKNEKWWNLNVWKGTHDDSELVFSAQAETPAELSLILEYWYERRFC